MGTILEKADRSLHVLKEMQPLIKKRQAGERLSNEEQVWLESAGKEIWEKLLK